MDECLNDSKETLRHSEVIYEIHNLVQSALGRVAIIVGCHQRSDRSCSFRGRQVPLCCRCLGMIVGSAFAPLLRVTSLATCGILLLPLLADGLTQMLGLRVSSNWLRMLTGMLFGVGTLNLFISIARCLAKYGIYNRIF
jgi:uncharacterized membrane protein